MTGCDTVGRRGPTNASTPAFTRAPRSQGAEVWHVPTRCEPGRANEARGTSGASIRVARHDYDIQGFLLAPCAPM